MEPMGITVVRQPRAKKSPSRPLKQPAQAGTPQGVRGPLDGWRERLSQALTGAHISERKAGLQAGMANTAVRSILHKQVSPALETVERICVSNGLDLRWVLFGGTLGLPADLHRVPVIRPQDAADLLSAPRLVDALKQIPPVDHQYMATPSKTGDRAFGLPMTSTAMEPAIMRGDIVWCDGAVTMEPDDVVCAVINGEFAVRRMVMAAPGVVVLRCDNVDWQMPDTTGDIIGVVWRVSRLLRPA